MLTPFSNIQKSITCNHHKQEKGDYLMKIQMLSQEVRECIEHMREQQYESDEDNQMEGNKFVSELSQGIALFFNQTIYSINQLKKTKHYSQTHESQRIIAPQKQDKQQNITDQIQGDNLQSNFQSTQRKQSRQSDNLEGEQAKDIDEIYKAKEDKLDNLPKKPVSSFFMYYQDHSKEFTAQVGEVGGSRLAQLVADTWKKLSPEEKLPYKNRANADKQRYRDQIAKYIQEHNTQIEDMKHLNRIKKIRMKKHGRKHEGEDKDGDEMDSELVTLKIKGISQRQMKAADRKNYSHRPKAPVSSFFIFYQEEAKNIAQKYGETVGAKLAKLASNLWKDMSQQAKQKYEQAAKIERERYHQQMIQYKIDYPNQIQSRRKKISNSMKRALKMDSQLKKEEQIENNSSLSSDISDDKSNSSQSENSYLSSEQEEKKIEPSPVKPKRERKEKENPMPHKPKGANCSFFQYYHSNIQEFMKKEGESNKDAGSQFVRRASIKWKTLTQDQKQVYHEMARVDRDRYQRQMAFFKENYPAQYQILLQFNKAKQLKNKRKKMAKMEDLKEEEIDDIQLQ